MKPKNKDAIINATLIPNTSASAFAEQLKKRSPQAPLSHFYKSQLIPVDSLKELSKALTSLISFVIIIIIYIFIIYN